MASSCASFRYDTYLAKTVDIPVEELQKIRLVAMKTGSVDKDGRLCAQVTGQNARCVVMEIEEYQTLVQDYVVMEERLRECK